MRSDYERNRFRIIYGILAVIFLAVIAIWCLIAWGYWDWRSIGVIGFTAFFLVIIYIVVYRMLNHAYKNMEHASQIMNDMMEKGIDPPSEDYQDGTIGIMYSNFYKMVYAFLVTCIILYHFCCNSIHNYQSSNGLILYVTPIFLQISAHSFSSSSVSVVETVESTTSFT